MGKCAVDTCNEEVSKPGHKLCYKHWKMEQEGDITACEKCGKYKENDYPLCSTCYAKSKNVEEAPKGNQLSSTKIGKEFELSGTKVNQILAELGWIAKGIKGWELTPQGQAQGGNQRKARETGIPYVVWPEKITENKALIRTIKTYKGETDVTEVAEVKDSEELSFRDKFPATYRTQDGHRVRSRAEVIVDNWLYVAGKVHAYERKVPIEEDLYCDFYLPEGKVYIEFWGLEDDEKYIARKQAKLKLYEKYNLNLIELKDKDILNLDDLLPMKLLTFGVACE